MLTIRQLNKTIDSLNNYEPYFRNRAQTELQTTFAFVRYADSSWKQVEGQAIKPVKKISEIIPDSMLIATTDRANVQVNAGKAVIELMSFDYNNKRKEYREHLIEWHRKFTLSFACVVLFLIGAPLGSIIRKGGLGTPLVFAVIFFVIFHLFNTFGEKFVKESVMSPLLGMWLSTLILIPIGMFLTYKAMRDSQLFNGEYYHRTFKKAQTFLATFRKGK
jgi:lipopolysaccharide export system permease protein